VQELVIINKQFHCFSTVYYDTNTDTFASLYASNMDKQPFERMRLKKACPQQCSDEEVAIPPRRI